MLDSTAKENENDRLAADVGEFLKARGGYFKDEPSVLYDELSSKVKPPRPDELTKRLKAIAAKTPRLVFNAGNF